MTFYIYIDDVSAEGQAATSYTITATAGSNGTIAPYGEVVVETYGDQGFTISADPSYKISDVVVDSVSVGATAAYTFASVTTNHTITATFEIDPTVSTYTGTYIVEIGDPIFVEGKFIDLKIKKRLNQTHTCEVKIVNPSVADAAEIVRNAPLRVRVNGSLKFTGIIKRVDKDDNINIYYVYAEGGSSILSGLSTASTVNYEHTRSYYIIEDLLPAADWVILAGYGTYIDYAITPGPALNHISNICKMEGYDWDVTQVTSSRMIMEYTATQLTVDGATIENNYYDGRYGAYTTGSAENVGFSISEQTGNVLTVSTVPTGVATGDSVILYGKYVFQSGTHLGDTSTVAHFIINKSAYGLNRQVNLDKIKTSIIGVGQLPEVSRFISFATACTVATAALTSSESYLTSNITATATTLYLSDTSGYTESGSVQIGDEKIAYTSKTATTLDIATTTDRGILSTASAIHYVNDAVLLVSSLTFDDASSFPTTTGSVWLGAEKIEYATAGSTTINHLTRGASGTDKYIHYAGTYGVDAQYTEDSPETGSMVYQWGLLRDRISIIGATTRDALDKRVQQQLYKNATALEYGDFKLIATDFSTTSIVIGDEILVTDAAANDNYWRIVGVDYTQYRPLTIYFGQTDEYVLDDWAKQINIDDSATEKTQLTKGATISELSSDEKCGLVIYDDGSPSNWIELR